LKSDWNQIGTTFNLKKETKANIQRQYCSNSHSLSSVCQISNPFVSGAVKCSRKGDRNSSVDLYFTDLNGNVCEDKRNKIIIIIFWWAANDSVPFFQCSFNSGKRNATWKDRWLKYLILIKLSVVKVKRVIRRWCSRAREFISCWTRNTNGQLFSPMEVIWEMLKGPQLAILPQFHVHVPLIYFYNSSSNRIKMCCLFCRLLHWSAGNRVNWKQYGS